MRNPNRSLQSGGRRTIVSVQLMLLIAASQMAAQKKPDFSGRWELDTAKSQLRPTKWNSLALAVEPQGSKLKINVTLKYPQEPDYNYQIPLTTDGTRVSVDMGKNTRVYHSTWLGAKLVIKWNEDGERTETWSLSQDGRTLTIIGSAKLTSGGAENWKYVMERK